MKITYLVLILLLVSCSTYKTENYDERNNLKTSIDSMIEQSQKGILSADSAIKKSDSTITGKVEKTVEQITALKSENKQLKIENHVLKAQLNDINNSGEYFELLPVSNN